MSSARMMMMFGRGAARATDAKTQATANTASNGQRFANDLICIANFSRAPVFGHRHFRQVLAPLDAPVLQLRAELLEDFCVRAVAGEVVLLEWVLLDVVQLDLRASAVTLDDLFGACVAAVG